MPPLWLIKGKDFRELEFPKESCLIDPILPKGEDVFLHGKSSIGKSPVTWHMMKAIALGEDFMGLKTQKGRTILMEVDTGPFALSKRVIPFGIPDEGFDFFDAGGQFDILTLKPHELISRKLQEVAAEKYDLVVINTFRKVFSGDDKVSDIVTQVTGKFRHLFPDACRLYVHHNVKDSRDPNARINESESFSGSLAIFNNAQSVLHLRKSPKSEVLHLEHTKSQNEAPANTINLRLGIDGFTLEHLPDDTKDEVREFLLKAPPDLSRMDLYIQIKDNLKISLVTARRHVASLEKELGVRFGHDGRK